MSQKIILYYYFFYLHIYWMYMWRASNRISQVNLKKKIQVGEEKVKVFIHRTHDWQKKRGRKNSYTNYSKLLRHFSKVTKHINKYIVIALFSPEAGDTNRHFIKMMRCKNTKYSIQKILATQYTVKYLLFILVNHCPSSWENNILLSPRKRSKFEIRNTAPTECVSLLHHHKVEIS